MLGAARRVQKIEPGSPGRAVSALLPVPPQTLVQQGSSPEGTRDGHGKNSSWGRRCSGGWGKSALPAWLESPKKKNDLSHIVFPHLVI